MTKQAEANRILLGITGWDPDDWQKEFARATPNRPAVLEPSMAGDPSIRYAVVWKQKPSSLANLPNLEVVFSLGAGVDHIFHDPGLPDVPIVRVVSEDLTARMSEYIVWQVLDHHRLGPRYRAQQAQHIWHEDRRQPAAHEVHVGILGLGVLGRDAAAKLSMLGFKVSGWSRRPQAIDGVKTYDGKEGLKEFLKTPDILVCLLPLTPETKGILSLQLFLQLKKEGPLGAPILINAGRGGLQNEADILAALDRGVLSAVSLDVFNQEPLPTNSPFWDHPKVTITPHAAASSSTAAIVPEIVAQMDSYERGEPLKNLVDRKAQY